VVLVLKLALAATLITYLVQSGGIQFGALSGLLHRKRMLLLAFVIAGMSPALGAVRWWVLLRTVSVRLPLLTAWRLTLVGLFFNLFLPGAVGGDAVKAVYASRVAPDGRKIEAVTTVLIDRVLGLGTLLLLGIVGACLVPVIAPDDPGLNRVVAPILAWVKGAWVWIAVGSLGAALGLIGLLWWRRRDSAGAAGDSGGQSLARRMAKTLAIAASSPGALASVIGLSALAHLLAIAAIFIVGRALGGELGAIQHIYVVPLGFIINAIPGTPGGIGIGEAAFEKLYNLALGRDASMGAEACLGWRVIIAGWSLVGGAVWLLHRATPSESIDSDAAGTASDAT
jgi:uncharacterized membrane protein YbhN (UPF0104 family)